MKLIFTILLLCLTLAFAHPVRPKGTVSLMTDLMQDTTQFDTIYSMEYYWGLGFRYHRIDRDSGETVFSYIPMTTFLLQRWNNENSQANIYGYAGYGNSSYEVAEESEGSILYGIQADWETTKHFLMAKHEYLKSDRDTISEYYQLRAGFSAYPASYYELWSWYMIQVSQNRAETAQIDITPLMRFFYKNVMWEIGAPHRGGFLINLMLDY